MKMQVIVRNLCKAGANANSIEITAMPNNTVLEVRERIASITNTNSFPDQKMLFKGTVLDSNQPLRVYDVTEGDVLEFVFQPSEEVLVKQLSDLLGVRAMSIEELGLLYIHRHGMSLGDVLEVMGYDARKLRSFLEGKKCFAVDAGLIKAVQDGVPHGPIEVSVKVELQVSGKISAGISDDEVDETILRLEASQSVAKAKEIIAASVLIPFPDQQILLGKQKLEDELSLHEAGVTDGASLVLSVQASEAVLASQLETLLQECTALSPNELSLHYCQRFGTPVFQALRILGLQGNIKRFLEDQPRFAIKGGCVTLINQSQVDNSLEFVIRLLSEACFLNIGFIEKDCQSSHGDASVVVFVRSLPEGAKDHVLASLCKAVASSLEAGMDDGCGIDRVSTDGELIHVHKKGETVCIRLTAASP